MSNTEQRNKGGRPKTLGLKYYPLHASIFSSKKMSDAEDILDPTGEAPHKRLLMDKFVTRFYSEIFSRGYFMPWNDEEEAAMCGRIGNGVNRLFLKLYLNAMLASGILNADMYRKYNILTSRGIQQKWLEISKLINRHKPTIEEEYFIPSYKNDFLRDGTRVSSRRNKGNLKNKPDVNSKSTVIHTPESGNNEIPTQETNIPSGNNLGSSNNQPGFPYSTTAINNKDLSSISIIVEEEKKVPQETPVTSGINANNSQFTPDETGSIPNEPKFIPQETKVYSPTNYPKISSATADGRTYPLDVCMFNFLYNKQYETTRHTLMIGLGVKDWTIEHMKDFCEAFNRSKRLEAIYELTYHGKGGWCSNFKNWIPKAAPDYKTIDPNILYTEKEIANGNQRTNTKSHANGNGAPGAAGSKIGGIEGDQINELRRRKGLLGN